MVTEDICYKRNYLTNVVARIDFVNEIPNIKTALQPDIKNEIIIYFPIDEPHKVKSRMFEFDDTAIRAIETESTEWRFYGRDREKTLVIKTDSIIMEYLKYQSYINMKDEFLCILSKFIDIYGDTKGKRFGLRYINNITIGDENPLEWNEYINSELLVNMSNKPDKLSRMFHLVEYNLDDFNIVFRFGISNPDYPAIIRKRSFILDYDAYYSGLLDWSDVKDNLDKFHKEIQALFEYSITEQLRKKMNG